MVDMQRLTVRENEERMSTKKMVGKGRPLAGTQHALQMQVPAECDTFLALVREDPGAHTVTSPWP